MYDFMGKGYQDVYHMYMDMVYFIIFYIICDCVWTGWTLACPEPGQQQHLHQERAHSPGSPVTDENESQGFEGSHSGYVAQS